MEAGLTSPDGWDISVSAGLQGDVSPFNFNTSVFFIYFLKSKRFENIGVMIKYLPVEMLRLSINSHFTIKIGLTV